MAFQEDLPDTIRLRLKSNGTPDGTVITDDNDRVVENIKEIYWSISGSRPAHAVITVVFMEVEITGDFEIQREVVPPVKLGGVDYSAPGFDDPT